MNELSIQIHIAGRSYPLSVKPSEEEKLRMAGKMIREKLESYQEQFALRDQQDALALFALEAATELLSLREQAGLVSREAEHELDQIGEMLAHIQL